MYRARHRGQLLARGRWVALLVVLAALVVGVSPDARGWRADHGHVTLGGVVPAHTHPGDDRHDTPPAERTTVGFTDPDGLGAGGAIDVPAAPSVGDRLRGVIFEVPTATQAVVSHPAPTHTPPPRA